MSKVVAVEDIFARDSRFSKDVISLVVIFFEGGKRFTKDIFACFGAYFFKR